MVEGALVISKANRSLGIAKVTRVKNGVANIEWFDSIANPAVCAKSVPLGHLIPWRPEPQARVYFGPSLAES